MILLVPIVPLVPLILLPVALVVSLLLVVELVIGSNIPTGSDSSSGYTGFSSFPISGGLMVLLVMVIPLVYWFLVVINVIVLTVPLVSVALPALMVHNESNNGYDGSSTSASDGSRFWWI